MIGIVDYGMGNLGSVKNALDYIGANAKVVTHPKELGDVDKIVLPGVGAFGMAMYNLTKNGFSDIIKELVLVKRLPILGICLGMQLLFESSDEHGFNLGLGLIKGKVTGFKQVVAGIPVPHMGWNSADANTNALLFKSIGLLPNFYFVHSYFCQAENSIDVSSVTEYGISFHSSVESGNIFGCQFHPEKSQKDGLAIYKNYNNI